MIKAVIFDVDGTLLDSFESNLKFFQSLLITAGYRAPTREEYLPLFHVSMMDFIKLQIGPQPDEEILRVFKLAENQELDYPVDIDMTEGAEKVVRDLSKDYILGIVTSRVKNYVYEAPKLAALEKYFKVAVSYEDTLNHKPHPDPLFLAAKILGIDPKECVYIGDVENDIKAAHSAGMKAILFSKENTGNPHAHTSNFEQIPDLIKNLR